MNNQGTTFIEVLITLIIINLIIILTYGIGKKTMISIQELSYQSGCEIMIHSMYNYFEFNPSEYLNKVKTFDDICFEEAEEQIYFTFKSYPNITFEYLETNNKIIIKIYNEGVLIETWTKIKEDQP